MIEEAPAPGIAAEQIAFVGERCAEACRQIGYCGVGHLRVPVEDGQFYFIEMNTRMQVEHPVTEMTTGIDIVQQQLRVAARRAAVASAGRHSLRGHAFECRINAEDPNTFTPSPGRITAWSVPGGFGVRVDTHAGVGLPRPAATTTR